MRIKTGITPFQYNSGAGELLKENKDRTGFIIKNDTNATLLISYSEKPADENIYSDDIGPQSSLIFLNVPEELMYKGIITFKLKNATSGKIMVTEFFKTNI